MELQHSQWRFHVIKVSIAGKLGKAIGSNWNLKVSNFQDLFNAIEANTGKLRNYLARSKEDKLAIFVDDDLVEADRFLNQPIKGKQVKIIPVLAGGAGVIAGFIVTKIGLEGFAAVVVEFVLTAVISVAISYGISLLISKLLRPDDPDATQTSSFVFSSAENVTQQGQVVPVGYGRMVVGSNVVSVVNTSIDKTFWQNPEDPDQVELDKRRVDEAAKREIALNLMGGGGGLGWGLTP